MVVIKSGTVVTEDIKYEDFILSGLEYLPSASELKSTASVFESSGFNPTNLFAQVVKKMANQSVKIEEAAKHIGFMIILFFVRGADLSNIKEGNTEGKLEAVNRVKEIINTYGLVSSPTGDNRALSITLPRIAMTFAPLAHSILVTINHTIWPVTCSEMRIPDSGFCFPNYVPCMLSEQDLRTPTHLFIILGLFLFILYTNA